MDCGRCGTCCTAPDIGTLNKPLGIRCAHLGDDWLCGIYGKRPAVCRGYRPDEICTRIAAPTLEERVEKYLELFSLKQREPSLYRNDLSDSSPSDNSP